MKKTSKKQPKHSYRTFFDIVARIPKKYIFPILVGFVFLVLVSLGISGSSIGMYHPILEGGTSPDTIIGDARAIRADEWLLITSKTIAQSYEGYPSYNENIGPDGENVSLRPDIPTTNINTIFRPQNWAFLVLPLENALAYKWWFFTAFAMLAAYAFSLRFFSKSIFVAIGLSILLVYSPLPQWTYREFIFLPFGFGLTAIILADKLQLAMIRRKGRFVFDRTTGLKVTLATLALAYAVVGYILVLYPPTQVAVAIVLAALYLDVVRRRQIENKSSLKLILRAQTLVAVAVVIAGVVTAGLFLQQKETVAAIRNTEHPGVRHIESGRAAATSGRFRNVWIGGSAPLILQKDGQLQASEYFSRTTTGNQSEASTYQWFLPLLLIFVMTTYLWTKKRFLPWFSVAASVFVMVWIFVPGLSLPLIDQVQPNRWQAAVGLSTFALLGFLHASLKDAYSLKDFRRQRMVLVACTVVFVAFGSYLFMTLNSDFPRLVTMVDYAIFGLLAVLPPLLLALRYYKIALGLLVAVTLAVNINVNPLHRGVASATQNDLVTTIREHDSRDQGVWLMAAGTETFEAIPTLAGAKSVTSHYSYPQDFWKHLDLDDTKEEVYNRAAHIRVSLTDDDTDIYLQAPNSIGVNLNPCDGEIIAELDIEYVVTRGEFAGKSARCLVEIDRARASTEPPFVIYRTIEFAQPLGDSND